MHNRKAIDQIIDIALKEDIHDGDITTNTLVSKKAVSQAYIFTKEKAVVCGVDIVKRVFKKLDPKAQLTVLKKDGSRVFKNEKIILIKAKTRAVLTGERVALNFLSHLSGIATKTHAFVKECAPYKVQISDTRKTTPGLRTLEKMAVRCGGGVNHRFHLNEMIFIKDNHRAKITCTVKSSLSNLVHYAKQVTHKQVEIEVDNLLHFKEVLKSHPDIILLDNMSVAQIKKAVLLKKKLAPKANIKLEASGNVQRHDIRKIARTGVDRISSGALTHTKKSIDYSLELIS